MENEVLHIDSLKLSNAKDLLHQLNDVVEKLKGMGFIIEVKITEGDFLN